MQRKTSNTAVRRVCALLFLLFSFAWLYWFQGDMLAVAQHGLSDGVTHYDHFIGAVICTGVLFGLQLLVYAFVRLSRCTHALTYLPSMLMLAFVSSVSFPFSWGGWPWVGPPVLMLWGWLVVQAKKLPSIVEEDKKGSNNYFSRCVWLNVLQMVALMLMVAAVSNTKAVDHFKAHAEVALSQGDAEEALRVGCRSSETDESLTLLRIFALSQKNELAERLFEYPVAGSKDDMLPLAGSMSRLQLLADTVIWDYFGQRPDSLRTGSRKLLASGSFTVTQYLDSLECGVRALQLAALRDSLGLAQNTTYRDYRLMGYLIDRQLDSFVVRLPRYYAIDESLPRHYQEALMLYQQQNDTLLYNVDAEIKQLWKEFCQYDSLYANSRERRVRIDEYLRGTYWYYYFQ